MLVIVILSFIQRGGASAWRLASQACYSWTNIPPALPGTKTLENDNTLKSNTMTVRYPNNDIAPWVGKLGDLSCPVQNLENLPTISAILNLTTPGDRLSSHVSRHRADTKQNSSCSCR
nr:hypothetical protein CFP56_63521 [Quercus suber]